MTLTYAGVRERYRNGRYFVSKVWYGQRGIQLPRSREELVTSKLVASAKPEIVVLTARVLEH